MAYNDFISSTQLCRGYKAFVSSTFIDLKDHRAHVIEMLRKAGIHVDPMEEWTSDNDEPKHFSVERMHDCDFCILLVGARRGHIPENETLSITQMEYKEAIKRGIDVLPFLYDGNSAWPPAYFELNDDEELRRWRAELKEHKGVGTFTTDPASVGVGAAVSRWLQKQNWPEVLKTYLETLRDAHASIRFLGVGHYKDRQDRPIEDLFVDLRAASNYISPDISHDQWPETSSLLAIMSAHNRLVLLGDPGSGKSTLVSWIVSCLTRRGKSDWKRALNDRIPFVMVLRELPLDSVKCWDDLLKAYFSHWTARLLGRFRYQTPVAELFDSGRAVIILDGLDEVGNLRVQRKLREAVWEGMRRYEHCAWLLTSRVVGYLDYHHDHESGQYTSLRYLAPFADNQIKEFVHNWFTNRDTSAIRASEEATRLVDAIHANHYTLRLARSPNLLTMMALIYRERARLPHGRALLYTDIANAYLHSIDEHRRIERLGYSLRDMKQWLGRIGFEMQLRRNRWHENQILVEGSDVREWVVGAMRDAGQSDSSEAAADAFIDEICRRSGLLVPRGEDKFAFTHLSFQEYFAAVFFVRQFVSPPRRMIGAKCIPGAEREDLYLYAGEKIWHEPLILLTELIFADHQDWLEELLFCLFGDGFSDLTSVIAEPISSNKVLGMDRRKAKATLLAKLTIDPHTGIKDDLKRTAIARCCNIDAANQKIVESIIIDNHLDNVKPVEQLPVLLNTDSEEDRSQVWKIFADTMCHAEVRAIAFAGLWASNYSILADNTKLEALVIDQSNSVDVARVAAISSLRTLCLTSSRIFNFYSISSLTGLVNLNLTGSSVSDVSPLVSLTRLRTLNLRKTQVKDITPLASLTALIDLDLMDTEMDDITPLASLTTLRTLELRNTKVTDVASLASLSQLVVLNILGCQVTEDSIRTFQNAVPKCCVLRNTQAGIR